MFYDFLFCETVIKGDKKSLSETVGSGDSLSAGGGGGINAGITTVWFNPKGIENDSDIKPDYTIKELSEVPGLLSQISAKI